MIRSSTLRAGLLSAAFAAALGLSFSAWPPQRSVAEEARVIPAPASDLPAIGASEVAVLAGGCFWGVQGGFQSVAGGTRAVSGSAGGEARTARYEAVSAGATGHAEAVRVTFDPKRISYGRILQIYFSVAHDPTQRDRQGPDHGTQYRSAIFPENAEQARVAKAYIAQLDGAHASEAALSATIEPGHAFYPAEGYHQDFMVRNPSYPYIVINDAPKVDSLRRLFPDLYRAEARLVASAG